MKVWEPSPAPIRWLLRYGGMLFFLFLAGALAGFNLIETIFNGGFSESIDALWLPVALGMLYFLWYVRPQKGVLWIWMPLIYGSILLMAWPQVMLINAFLPARGEIVYQGPVTKKWISRGRSTSYQLVIENEADRSEVTLTVSPRSYYATKEGDRFVSHFTLGGFGIPYRWRYGGTE